MAPRRRVRRRSVSRAPGRDCPGTHAAADDRWPVEPVAWAREPLGAERALRVARDPACEAQPSGGRAPGHGFGVQGAGPGSDQRSPGERRTAVARSRFTDRCRGTRCACCCMPPSRSPRTGTASTPRPTDRPGPCRRSRRRPAFTGRALVNSARDDRALCRPGDQAICRPADLPTKRYADLPTGRPADRALRRPGDPTARRSGGRAIGRRGSGDAARAPDSAPVPPAHSRPAARPDPTWKSRCRCTPTRSSRRTSARLPTSSARGFRSVSVEERTVSALSRWSGSGAVALQLVVGGSRCLSVAWQ